MVKDSDGTSCSSNLYAAYRSNAKKRGISFEISRDDFLDMTKEPCHYCGAEPSRVHRHDNHGYISYYTYNGLDRVNSSREYSVDNCAPCCYQCNKAKWELSYDEFLDYIKQVYKHMLSTGML